MAALVAPGVVRFAVNGTYANQEVVNIVDMHMQGNFLGDDRSLSAFNQAGVIINQWFEDICSTMSDQYIFESVSWIDLDSDEGSTGSRTTTDQVTLPENGAGTWEAMPGNVAMRINKNITAKRGQRQGRMYIVGFAEQGTTKELPNNVPAAAIASNNTAFAAFLENINQLPSGQLPAGEYQSDMVVVHTKNGIFTDFSTVESLTVDPYLSSQVRRLRR